MKLKGNEVFYQFSDELKKVLAFKVKKNKINGEDVLFCEETQEFMGVPTSTKLFKKHGIYKKESKAFKFEIKYQIAKQKRLIEEIKELKKEATTTKITIKDMKQAYKYLYLYEQKRSLNAKRPKNQLYCRYDNKI